MLFQKHSIDQDEDAQYSAVGYCFGAPFVLDLAARGDIVAGKLTYTLLEIPLLTHRILGAIAHPAFLTEDHFKNIKSKLAFLSSF